MTVQDPSQLPIDRNAKSFDPRRRSRRIPWTACAAMAVAVGGFLPGGRSA